MIRVPVNNSVVDLVALQNFVTLLLLDDPRLDAVPIVPEIKFHMESDQQVDALWTLPRSSFVVSPSGVETVDSSGTSGGNNAAASSLVGAGLLVEMPGANCDSPAVTGPPLTWEVNVVAMEERNTNFLPGTGTCVTSEQLAQIVLDVLHKQAVFGYGTLQANRQAISPAHDWMSMKPGIVAYRASLRADAGRKQTQRSANVAASWSGDTLTLTCADAGASIWYTTDGSVPCAANAIQGSAAGVGATLYTLPFAVTSGTQVLFASKNLTAGTLLSAVSTATAP